MDDNSLSLIQKYSDFEPCSTCFALVERGKCRNCGWRETLSVSVSEDVGIVEKVN